MMSQRTHTRIGREDVPLNDSEAMVEAWSRHQQHYRPGFQFIDIDDDGNEYTRDITMVEATTISTYWTRHGHMDRWVASFLLLIGQKYDEQKRYRETSSRRADDDRARAGNELQED